jgi:hypothetical protein
VLKVVTGVVPEMTGVVPELRSRIRFSMFTLTEVAGVAALLHVENLPRRVAQEQGDLFNLFLLKKTPVSSVTPTKQHFVKNLRLPKLRRSYRSYGCHG